MARSDRLEEFGLLYRELYEDIEEGAKEYGITTQEYVSQFLKYVKETRGRDIATKVAELFPDLYRLPH